MLIKTFRLLSSLYILEGVRWPPLRWPQKVNKQNVKDTPLFSVKKWYINTMLVEIIKILVILYFKQLQSIIMLYKIL